MERYAESESQLRAALAIPDHTGGDPGLRSLAHMYLGSTLAAQNKLEEGIAPNLGEVYAFLGEAYAS